MRALVCSEYGPPESLAVGSLPEPVPDRGEVVIAVSHAGVSFVDTLMIRNLHQNKHPVPFAAGMEVAGRVTSIGGDVEDVAVGDSVAALVYDGGHAEFAKAKTREVFPLPDSVQPAIAAGMLSVYLTSYLALVQGARLTKREVLAVSGAAGGVGLAAVEIGKALGARVLAVASTQAKRNVAERRGADLTFAAEPEQLLDSLRDATGEDGTDVVFDPVAGPLYQPLFRSLGWNGRYLSIGFAGGSGPESIPRVPLNHLLVKNRSAVGFVLMYYRRFRPDLLKSAAAQLFEWCADGVIDPLVQEPRPLAQGATLMREIMDRKAVGKSVLEIC